MGFFWLIPLLLLCVIVLISRCVPSSQVQLSNITSKNNQNRFLHLHFRILSIFITITPYIRLMKSVTNWKHVCTYCKRAFSRSEHKARHERSHTGTKPFECKVCLRGFVRRDLLQRHIRTVHKKIISSEKGTAQVNEIIKTPISEEKVNSIIKVNYSGVNVIKMNFQQTHASYEFDSTLPQKKTIVIDMQRAIIIKNNKIQIPVNSFYEFYDIGLMYLNKLLPSHAYKTVSEDIVTLLIYLGSLISHDPHCNTIWSVVWKSLYEPDKSEKKVQDKFIYL